MSYTQRTVWAVLDDSKPARHEVIALFAEERDALDWTVANGDAFSSYYVMAWIIPADMFAPQGH